VEGFITARSFRPKDTACRREEKKKKRKASFFPDDMRELEERRIM